MDIRLILKAAEFAAHKHKDQRRKDAAASPYINHPIKVAKVISETGGVDDSVVLAAALLHDTIEDTQTSPEELEHEFGPAVRRIVEEVTDDDTLPKQRRKDLQIEHAKHLSPGATLVKLGDKICNVMDIIEHPPAGWSKERRIEYIQWAVQVVANCPSVNAALEANFAAVSRRALAEI